MPQSTPSYDEKLQSLLNASLLLNSTLSTRDVLHTLSLFATRHTGADRATLYLVDHGRDELVSEIAQGEERLTIRLPLGEGLAGVAAESGKPVRVDDAYADERFDRSVDERTGYRTGAVLAVPFRDRRSKVMGVLQVMQAKGGGSFDEADAAYLATLASHAAVAIQNARLYQQLSEERKDLAAENARLLRSAPARAEAPVGNDPGFRAAVETTAKVAASTANVLIRGESGSGKGVLARYLHLSSPRRKGPFVSVNCAAIPENLVESELFGIEKGVATGVEARMGRLEAANGGTVFLDEIGDMPLEAQAKILKAIEDRSIERVGGRKPVELDVRIVAATHRDLAAMMAQREFREDLYYRLNVVTVEIPPLRARGDDLERLAGFFLARFAESNARPAMELSPDAVALLRNYRWPGNVRELENVIERAVVLSEGMVVQPAVLPPEIRRAAGEAWTEPDGSSSGPLPVGDLRESLDAYEKAFLKRALEHSEGVQAAAARALGISESNLRYKLKKHELEA